MQKKTRTSDKGAITLPTDCVNRVNKIRNTACLCAAIYLCQPFHAFSLIPHPFGETKNLFLTNVNLTKCIIPQTVFKGGSTDSTEG